MNAPPFHISLLSFKKIERDMKKKRNTLSGEGELLEITSLSLYLFGKDYNSPPT
jgi:hypothetical protein